MKRIAKWICILSLFIVALYFACVYATGYAIRYGLKNIDRYVKQGLNVESQAKFVNDIFEISYTGEKSSLFTENGFISIKIDKSVKKVPLNISIGFINADLIADTSAINATVFELIDDTLADFLGQGIDDKVKLKSSKSSLLASVGIIKGALIDVSFSAPYKSGNKKLTFNSKISASFNKNIQAHVVSKDINFLHFGAKKFDFEIGYHGFDRLEHFDSIKLFGENLHLTELNFSDLNVLATGIDNKDNLFDLKIDFSSKNIVNYINDVKANMLAKGLSYELINLSLKEGNFDNLLDSLKRIDILNLEAQLDNSLKTYVGVFRKNPIKFKSKGYMTFDPNEDLFLQKALLTIKTKDANGASFLFRKKNGEYICDLEYKNERIYINGMRF